MPESTNITPTDDFEAWTEADDAFLRAHLTSLRDDLDPHAMPEPALIRAKVGRERRAGRRTWTLAAVAAAAVVAAAVLWNPLAGRDGTTAVPGTTSATSADTSVSTSTPPAVPTGPMPGAEAWRTTLVVPVLPVVEDQTSAEGSTVGGLCSSFPDLGRVTRSERVFTRAGKPDATLIGTQAFFALADPERAQGRIADAFAKCTPTSLKVVPNPAPSAGAADPMVWSFTVDGRQGLTAVAQGRGGVTIIEVPDVTAMGMKATADGAYALAESARSLLDGLPGPGTATSTAAQTTSACGDVSGVKDGLDTTGANAAQRAKAAQLAAAVAACDTAGLRAILTTDGTMVSLGGQTVDQVLTLPANKERYTALATVLTLRPGIDTQFGLARWPKIPTTDAEWAAIVASGLYTQAEVDRMRPNGYTGWSVVIDSSGKVTAFKAGD
jgi:hypothetical protein